MGWKVNVNEDVVLKLSDTAGWYSFVFFSLCEVHAVCSSGFIICFSSELYF